MRFACRSATIKGNRRLCAQESRPIFPQKENLNGRGERTLAREFNVKPQHAQAVVQLFDEGNTVPFIARYRKEQHGTMDCQTIRALAERLHYLRGLEQRRQEVSQAIEAQGKLTPELAAALGQATTLAEVEDLYRPYRPKRRTRASIAREKGLEPLAEALRQGKGQDALALAQPYVQPEKGVEKMQRRRCRAPAISWRKSFPTMRRCASGCGTISSAPGFCRPKGLQKRTRCTGCTMTLPSG